MNLKVELEYSDRVGRQIGKTIKMMDYIQKNRPSALYNMPHWNVIDDFSVLIVNNQIETIVEKMGDEFAKAMLEYLALPDVEEYELCAKIYKIINTKSTAYCKKEVTL